jgi:hypothetical protein
MWEARVLPGRLDDAVAHLVRTAVPAALGTPGCAGAEAFVARGEQERVVLITRWDAPPDWLEPGPAEELWSRSHAWHFEPAT